MLTHVMSGYALETLVGPLRTFGVGLNDWSGYDCLRRDHVSLGGYLVARHLL